MKQGKRIKLEKKNRCSYRKLSFRMNPPNPLIWSHVKILIKKWGNSDHFPLKKEQELSFKLFKNISVSLFVCCFQSHSRIFHSYGDITVDEDITFVCKGLLNLGLRLAPLTFEQKWIFTMPHKLYINYT